MIYKIGQLVRFKTSMIKARKHWQTPYRTADTCQLVASGKQKSIWMLDADEYDWIQFASIGLVMKPAKIYDHARWLEVLIEEKIVYIPFDYLEPVNQ